MRLHLICASTADSCEAETDAAKRTRFARRIEALATGITTPKPGSPDAMLLKHLQKIPMPRRYGKVLKSIVPDERFGKYPLGPSVVTADLIVQAPAMPVRRSVRSRSRLPR